MRGVRREGGIQRWKDRRKEDKCKKQMEVMIYLYSPVYGFACLFTVVIECSVTLGCTRHMRTHQCQREFVYERERERWEGWVEGGRERGPSKRDRERER